MRKKIIYFSFLFFALGFCFSQNTSIEYLVEKNGMRQLFTLDITGNKSLFYSNLMSIVIRKKWKYLNLLCI